MLNISLLKKFRKSQIFNSTNLGTFSAYSNQIAKWWSHFRFRQESKLGVRIRLNFSLKKSGLSAFIEKTAMELRKSIINDNVLTKRDDHLAYSVKKIKILIVKSKMAIVWKPWILRNFQFINLDLRH